MDFPVTGLRLHEQHIDTMRVDHLFARRPGEDCKAAVLRSDQCQRVSLIVYELGRRQVTRAAMLYRRNHDRCVADNRLRALASAM